MNPSVGSSMIMGHASAGHKQRLDSLFDSSLCAIVVIALLVNLTIGPLTPLTVFAFVITYAIVRRERLPKVLSSSWPLLLIPLLSLLSVFWSESPNSTLRYGLYFFVSVLAGVMMGSGMRHRDVINGLFWGLLLYGVVALLLGRWVIVGTTGELAFAGLLGSKNASGEVAGLSLLVSISMLASSMKTKRVLLVWASIIGLIVSSFTLFASSATGALISGVVASCCLVFWLISANFNTQVRTSLFVLLLLLLVALFIFQDTWFPPLFEFVLDATGKDAGVTGRDILWSKADSLISQKPLFGNGYGAFWVHNNLDAEYLWREMGIDNRMGFNFHNTFREVTVDLGYFGFALFVSIIIIGAGVLFIKTMLNPEPSLILASACFVYFIFKIYWETFAFGGMHLVGMLFYTVFAMGFSCRGSTN